MRNKLISTLAGVAFSLAASGLAFAADIATKAAAPSPAPVYNWTGWYAGVNAGASFGRAKTDINVTNVALTSVALCCVLPTGFARPDDESNPSSFIGGGQIGYNWQYSPLIVVGLEADFQGTRERESINSSIPFNVTSLNSADTVPGTTVTNYTTQIDWFGTARVRAGYLFGDGVAMTYVTGGLAYGKVKINGTNTVSGLVDGSFPFSISHAIGHSQVQTGWTVGSGTEGKLLIPGWTYKIEYLYMDLGTLDATGVITGASAPFPLFSVTGGQITTHTHFTDNIVRVGLNYQFH
jgi:outer membrane immunogenic protein